MNKVMSTLEWKPADNIVYSEESSELEIIKSNKNCLVSAGPGAGKTELLAQKASFLLETNTCIYPRKILALSFKVDAKDNIKKRVDSRCGKELSNRFISNTYDSFFKNLLDRFSNLLPDFYKPLNEYNLLLDDKVKNKVYKCAGLDVETLTNEEKDFYKITYLTEYSLPLNDSPYHEIAKKAWPILLKGNKDIEPQISFPMIARLVEYLVRENPIIKKSLELTYSHIFLDEFQDTTLPQYDAIKACFENTSTVITAVGDRKQRIMGWAGAAENIFNKYKSDFNAEERTILINHRSSPKLIKLQNDIIEEMLGESLNIKTNKKLSENCGEIELLNFKNENDEAEFLCKKIEILINKKEISINDICILTRNWTEDYSDELINKLKDINIEARVENIYQDILREDLVKIILSIIKLAVSTSSPDDWIFIINILKKINGYSLHTKTQKINLLEKDLSIYVKEIDYKLNRVKSKEDFEEVVKSIIDYLGTKKIKSLYNQYKKGKYMESIINKFINLFWNDYNINFSWSNAIDRFKGEYTIPIMSIHKSKGLEFNTVILLGVEGTAFWGINKNKDEELCNFFVAVSRAKENLFFTYTNKRLIKDKIKLGEKDKVQLFYNLMNKSGVVESHDFSENFKDKYLKYFDEDDKLLSLERKTS